MNRRIETCRSRQNGCRKYEMRVRSACAVWKENKAEEDKERAIETNVL